MQRAKILHLILGPILLSLIMLFQPLDGFSREGWIVIAVAALMITWWITEAIPLSITALLPIILFPLFGVMTIKETTVGYAHPVVFLFVGSFIIARAIEKCGLHKRVALSILQRTGNRANGIVFGLMFSTALISMWMPNTAAAVLMLPIGLAIREIVLKEIKQHPEKKKNYFTITMILSIAFGANIGGMATLVGTPTNALLAAFVNDQFDISITFWNWLMIGFPFATILLILGWITLTKLVYPNKIGMIKNVIPLIDKEIKKLGVMKQEEKLTAFIFILTVSLWLFKGLLPINISDTSIALLGAVLCFALPVSLKQTDWSLLSADDIPKLPWGILFLFGGGLALANAIQNTGLSELIAHTLSTQEHFQAFSLIVLALVIILFMTEIIGNVPVISVMLPVLTGVAIAFQLDPLMVIIPATLAASCAFMLPTATPPNAVVFSSGQIKVLHMVKAGIFMNLLSIAILAALVSFCFPVLFDVIGFK